MAHEKESQQTDLITEVDASVRSVHTRALDISFNEILDMYVSEELIIDPSYQRLFRWTEAAQSRFIESLVLEMPIPPLYMLEIDDNVYELIDGLQRISTWLHFRGRHPLRVDEDGNMVSLRLQDCDIVPTLNDLTYDELPNAIQIKLKRNFIRVEVIRKSSDPRLRYYMFKRLNTGGEPLSPQEIRNCTIRLLDPSFNDFLVEKAQAASFHECTQHIRSDRKESMYREELVLRFFALKNYRTHYNHLVQEFLTHYMEAVSDPDGGESFDYETESTTFDRTFQALRKIGGDQVFAGPNTRFTVTIFEALSLGIQIHLDQIDINDEVQMERIRSALDTLRGQEDFREVAVGGGLNYAHR